MTLVDINVLIVDDHPIIREGLKALLDLEKGIILVGEAASAMECLEFLETCRPHVVLMDLKMPGIDGIHAAGLIKCKYPQIKIILLTNYDDEEYVIQALKTKVDGYVLKNVSKGDVVRIIRHVFSGKSYIDQLIAHKVFDQFSDHSQTNQIIDSTTSHVKNKGLSQRELQILELIVEGKTNKEIANNVCLSINTIKVHLKNIYSKLGVHTRSKAVKIAIQANIVHV